MKKIILTILSAVMLTLLITACTEHPPAEDTAPGKIIVTQTPSPTQETSKPSQSPQNDSEKVQEAQ